MIERLDGRESDGIRVAFERCHGTIVLALLITDAESRPLLS